MAQQDANTKKKDAPGIDRRLLRRMGAYLRPYAPWVLLAVALTVTAAFLGPLQPKLIQVAIDQYIAEGAAGEGGVVVGVVQWIEQALGVSQSGFQVLVSLLVGALVLQGMFMFVNNYLTQWIGQQAIYDLRTDVFRHIQRQPLTFFDRTPIGRLITRTTSDVEAISDVLSSGLVVIMGGLFQLFFITVLMFSLNWVLALATLAVMPLMVWATFWFRRNVREQYRATRKQIARINSFIQEHVTGMPIVQLFGREEEEARRFREVNADHRAAHVRTIFYFALFWPAIQIVSDLALALVLWLGGLRAMTGTLTVGVLIAFVLYARQFFRPIRSLSDQYNTLQRAMAGAERIFGLLDEDHALREAEAPVEIDRLRGEIRFEHVWFTYDDVSEDDVRAEGARADAARADAARADGARADGARADGAEVNWILKDVSFAAEPGDVVAIVGATGAGKTTIINLLLRFYEVQRGRITVDGIDIRELRLKDLRRHIGLVLQDVFLFSGSIEENLTLGDESVREEHVRRAAEVVQADRFIEQLPAGYQQDVKERGASLSHGQRQLLAFVRALVYDPDILVLDEATSSVDTETEGLIQQALERLVEGRTSIAIAHRLSTIQDADQILVMHRGELREQGTHQELLALGGLYRKLYELQYEGQQRAAA